MISADQSSRSHPIPSSDERVPTVRRQSLSEQVPEVDRTTTVIVLEGDEAEYAIAAALAGELTLRVGP